LYRCEALSFALKEERELQVFKNRDPSKIFSGPKNDEASGEFRVLHEEELK
jgi:hypothetical protein